MLKIIISPAKKMNLIDEYPRPVTDPVFLDRTLQLHHMLSSMELSSLKTLWKCSDRLAQQNYERLHAFMPEGALSPALLSYEGIQYQHIAPSVFTDDQWDYVSSHLRILSGFYGVLRPTDRVIPYRLEMQARLKTDAGKDLYAYWGEALCNELLKDGMTSLVNLASEEYSKAVLPYIKRISPQTRCVTCIFGELIDGKIKVKGTQAKIARGEMVRWMSEKQIERPEDLRGFKELGYHFSEEYSTEEKYVFTVTVQP